MGRKLSPGTTPFPKRSKPIGGAKPKITLDQTVALMENSVLGDTYQENANKVGVSHSMAIRYSGIDIPEDFPDINNDPDWHNKAVNQIKTFITIAAFKATKKMADKMQNVDVDRLAVASAILVDKLLILNGSPTSISVTQHHVVKHDDVMDRLKQAKEKPLEA